MKAIITNERGAYKHLNGQTANIRIDACGILQFQNPESGFWTDTTFDKIKAL